MAAAAAVVVEDTMAVESGIVVGVELGLVVGCTVVEVEVAAEVVGIAAADSSAKVASCMGSRALMFVLELVVHRMDCRSSQASAVVVARRRNPFAMAVLLAFAPMASGRTATAAEAAASMDSRFGHRLIAVVAAAKGWRLGRSETVLFEEMGSMLPLEGHSLDRSEDQIAESLC